MENYNLIAYSIYLTITISITVFVGRNLHKNGYFLILDLFENEVFSRTLNNLLLTGYYLINIGYIALTIQQFGRIDGIQILLQSLAQRVGTILVILGVLHINNIVVLHLLSSHKKKIIHMFNHKI